MGIHQPPERNETAAAGTGEASASPARAGAGPGERLVVLGLYWQTSFWSLGPGMGVNSFFLAPQGFARLGHEIHVSAPRGKGQPAIENDHGMSVHRYRGAIRFDSNPLRPVPIRLTSRVVRYLYYLVIGTWNGVRLGRRIRPDIVIGYHYHSAAAAFLVARILGLPNITRLFGTQLNRIVDHRWKRLGAFMQVIALRTPASYIVMHDDGSEGDVVARRLGVPEGKLRFWPDGMERSMWRPGERFDEVRRSLRIPDDHLILFCVGRLTDDKNMGRLVEILPDVLRECPKVSLMLVGDGVERPPIEEKVRSLGVEEHVRITGAVPREELPRYFNLGDVFVGVSDRTNANLPPVEAMSCGKPVVALDTGGTRRLVEDGVTGVLVPAANWRADLPRALVALLRDQERRRRLGEAGREKVWRDFPSIEERQRMEVDLAVQAVREFRAGARR